MKEKWHIWTPIKDSLGKLHMEKLVYYNYKTELILKNDYFNMTIKFIFDGQVLGCYSSDEGKRLKMLNVLDKEYGVDFYKTQNFFIVENSEYLKWFNEETYNIYANYNIVDYVFLLSNDIIEVLSAFPPSIEIFS